MKIMPLSIYGLLIVFTSVSMVSCSCHDDQKNQTHDQERDEPGKVPPSPDIPEPPRNLGAPTQ